MPTLQGLTTMVITADDVESAATWYAAALAAEPYYRQPQSGTALYIEFRLGPDEDELGIMHRGFAPAGSTGAGASTTYWHVEDVAAAVTDLVSRGAIAHEPVTRRGAEFVTASVVDPFGNVIGLMRSPHWASRH